MATICIQFKHPLCTLNTLYVKKTLLPLSFSHKTTDYVVPDALTWDWNTSVTGGIIYVFMLMCGELFFFFTRCLKYERCQPPAKQPSIISMFHSSQWWSHTSLLPPCLPVQVEMLGWMCTLASVRGSVGVCGGDDGSISAYVWL